MIGLEDASAKAREFSRVSYLQLRAKHPRRAEKVKNVVSATVKTKLLKAEGEYDAAEQKRRSGGGAKDVDFTDVMSGSGSHEFEQVIEPNNRYEEYALKATEHSNLYSAHEQMDLLNNPHSVVDVKVAVPSLSKISYTETDDRAISAAFVSPETNVFSNSTAPNQICAEENTLKNSTAYR